MNKRAILLDDDQSFLRVLTYHIESAGFEVLAFTDPNEALQELKSSPVSVVFTDIGMPKMSGIEFIRELRTVNSDCAVVVISGLGSIDDAVEAMKLGALDFIRKPIEQNHLLSVLKKAYQIYELSQENRRLKELVEDHFRFGNMIGKSASMQELYRQAERVSRSQVTVLINGETGAGKEVLAKAIHLNSTRSDSPFVAINCAAIPGNLIESELFGHVKGAFTGATTDRKGLLAQANGGTFFMDEIGDLPAELQPKLLRILQEREYQPVGSNKAHKVDIRVICATHRNLEDMVKEGSFREDLFFRLNVIPLQLPPMRERRADTLLLFNHFLTEACREENREIPTITPEAATLLENYDWPGNVREIQNIALRCAVLSSEQIVPEDLPIRESPESSLQSAQLFNEPFDLEEYIDDIYIQALEKNEWNQSQTARFLNISRNSLVYRMKRDKLRNAFNER